MISAVAARGLKFDEYIIFITSLKYIFLKKIINLIELILGIVDHFVNINNFL